MKPLGGAFRPRCIHRCLPARYPDAFDSGTPHEYFTERDARDASFIVEESFSSMKVFWLKQDELIEALRDRARALGEADGNVLQIVLFGSLAEGRAVPGSDADILVLLREDPRPFVERVGDWQGRFSIGFPVEAFPYTEAERGSPVVEEALKRGRVLFRRCAR